MANREGRIKLHMNDLMMIADPFTSVCLMPYEPNDGIERSIRLKSQLYQIQSNSTWNEQKILKGSTRNIQIPLARNHNKLLWDPH